MLKTVCEVNQNVTVEVRALENLKHELFETRSSIEYADVALEKAEILLSYWTQEYSFSENPDPRAAIRWGGQVPSQNQDPEAVKRHGEQSFKWFYEYNRIFNFVDMAFDYLLEAKKILREAIDKGGGK